MNRIILAHSTDDDLRRALRQRLEAERFEVRICATAPETVSAFRGGASGALLGRLNDERTVDVLKRLVAIDEKAAFLCLCENADEGVEALRAGAYYAMHSPHSAEEAALLLRKAFAGNGTSVRQASGAAPFTAPTLIGQTPAVQAIRDTIERLRSSPTTSVLITGESGTGKDAVARAIHAATCLAGPFVYVTPSALPEAMLEGELFGVENRLGAGPARGGLVEQAAGGTLFLDEIADMPSALQAQLLRFVQQKTFRRLGGSVDLVSETRVVASSSRNIEAAIRGGILRSELVYRLAVVTLNLPPLRERRADIDGLVQHFVGLIGRRLGRSLSVTDAALELIRNYSWPGNVRELGNALERAALLSGHELLDTRHFSLSTKHPAVDYRLPAHGIDFRELERDVVVQALALAQGNQTRAASLLGMTRDQIRYRIMKFGMSAHPER